MKFILKEEMVIKATTLILKSNDNPVQFVVKSVKITKYVQESFLPFHIDLLFTDFYIVKRNNIP